MGSYEGLRHSLLLTLCQCVPWLPAAGPVTVAGRLAEVPPTAYPIQIAVARVRVGGGICMKHGPDDRHAVA